LAVPAVARAAEEKDKPQLVIAVKSLDGLIDDARYLASLAGKDADAKQLEETLKKMTGPDGLKGVDPKKPFGLYGRLNPKDPDKSEAVVLIPVNDEKALLEVLKGQNLTPDKGSDGVYKLTAPNVPYPFYFRFANDYAYITMMEKAPLAADRILAPSAVLPAETTSLLSISARIDQIPAKFRELFLDGFQTGVAKWLEDAPALTDDKEKKLRDAVVHEVQVLVKSIATEGRELRLSFDVDQKAGELSASVTFSGTDGSKLAASLADLGAAKSVAAGLVGDDSAMNLFYNFGLTEKLRKVVGDAFDAFAKKALDDETDAAKKQAGEAFLKAMRPTLQAGVLDQVFDVRGPGPKGFYTLVMASKVKDGLEIEKLVRNAVKDAPEKDGGKIDFDVVKVGDVNIHRGRMTEGQADADVKKAFGDEREVYFAFRDDAVILALGEEGLAAIKQAAAAKPKAGPLLQVQMSMARAAKLVAEQQPAAVEAAKNAFKDKNKDKFRLVVQGGKSLTVKFSMDAAIVTFGALVDELEKKDK
jgi:hypothetical protein